MELALHFERGREYQRAIRYHNAAAHKALRRNASQEAVEHLATALRLLRGLSDSPERDQQELQLLTTQGAALIASKGWGATDVQQIYARAHELYQMGIAADDVYLAPILAGLASYYLVRAEFAIARELMERLLSIGERVRDSTPRLIAHTGLGFGFFCTGDFVDARDQLQRATNFYDIEQHGALVIQTGSDAGVASNAFLSHTLWLLGYPDQALAKSRESVRIADQIGHPVSRASAALWAALLYQFRRDRQTLRSYADHGTKIAQEYGLQYWLAVGNTISASERVQRGIEGSTVELRLAGERLQSVGLVQGQPWLLTILAESLLLQQQPDEAMDAVSKALTVVHQYGERTYEAESYRLKGEAFLAQPRQRQRTRQGTTTTAEAEACFLKALEVAQQQGAKAWELRAAVSLARLWQRQKKKQEAHKVLAEIYGWFTEGFDTQDLQEAKALIEELSH